MVGGQKKAEKGREGQLIVLIRVFSGPMNEE